MERKFLYCVLISLVYFLILFSACRQEQKYSIKLSFAVPDSTPVELYMLKEEQAIRIDSVYCPGSYSTIRNTIENPQVFLLKYFNNQSIYLVVRPGDHIKITVDNSRQEISYYVEGSPDSKRIKELIDKQNIVLKQIDQLSKDWEQSHTDTTDRLQIDKRYQSLMLEHRDYTRKFIYSDPHSLANILALYQNFGRKSQPLFDRYDDVGLYSFVDSNLVPLYPETYAVKALNKEVTETKEHIAHKKYIDKTLVEGRLLPTLKWIDIRGDTILVGINQKHPLLLYLWASWNPYSVNELLSLQRFKNSPKGANVDIITFSLDTSPEKLNRFVTENAVEFPILCDYDYWDSELVEKYAVKQVPASILVNKEGFIVAKNIFSYELLNRINEITQ